MSSKTTIEWTDESHNPGIYGCSHFGTGCANCYAETMAHRLGNMGQPAYQSATEDWRWTRKVRTVPVDEAVASILNLPRRRGYDRPVRTFVTSMADMLHESIPATWTAAVIVAMSRRQDRIFQVLTHRGARWPEVVAEVMAALGYWPRNVWAGVSASNQAEVDAAVPGLLMVPGVRFLSLEPLLGPVNLDRVLSLVHMDRLTSGPCDGTCPRCFGPQVGWIIVGGESGPKARPMHPAWARSLRDQAVGAGVPFHFKQWGEWAPGEDVEANGTDWPGMYEHSREDGGAPHHSWPDAEIRETAKRLGRDVPASPIDLDTSVLRVGKHAAGRLLDGRAWDGLPE